MSRFIAPLGVVSILVVSIVFAVLNGAQRVTLNIGVTVLYGVPLTLVAFTGLFMGMVVMLVAGVRSDLRVRALLRQRLEDEDREERAIIDRTQQDLFSQPPVDEKGGDRNGAGMGGGARRGAEAGAGDGDADGSGIGAQAEAGDGPGDEAVAGDGPGDEAGPGDGPGDRAGDGDGSGDETRDGGGAVGGGGEENWGRKGGAVG
jgi:uncharacterized integral membrane protein